MKSSELELLAKLQAIIPSNFKVNNNSFKLIYDLHDQDDCATFDYGSDNYFVVCSDFVRGPGFHLFKLGIMNYFDCGYYVIMANISDIAAMAATPVGITTILRYSSKMSENDFFDSIKGMKKAADDCLTNIVGGDIGSYDEPVYSATAFGIVPKSKILRRKGIKVGQKLCVSKYIGIPATALAYFSMDKKTNSLLSHEEDILANSWKRPQAEINIARLLQNSGFASACMDISDGLKYDITKFCDLNNMGALLYEKDLPIHEITKKTAFLLDIDPITLAFGPSVDFSLLFSIDVRNIDECQQLFSTNNLPLWIIGEVMEKSFGYKIYRENGTLQSLPGQVWDQKSNLILPIKS